MATSFAQFNPTRIRSYVFRLPFFTRVVLLGIIIIWISGLQGIWNIEQWGALIPDEINLGSLYRLNTYPVIHVHLVHALFNILALAPLLERFEAEHGTLVTLAMFAGPLSTLPAGLYLLIERGIWRGNNPILGSGTWVFELLAIETMKTYRANPYFSVGPYKIPTWSTPIIATLFVSFLIPNTSLLAHLCSVAVGIVFGMGYLKFLAPPEKVLRWVEGKMDLLGRIPHYVSVDQKTYGRYGVLPTSNAAEGVTPATYTASTQRLGP
ncbi:MAG: putative rhomboid protease [Sarcosagium campestre]|nr:MAG: putative rhomboid protease [Sarcosagium campestre]